MGQKQVKAGLVIQQQARGIVDAFNGRFSSVAQLKSLTYDQFVHEIQLLNQILDELTNSTHSTVSFSTEKNVYPNFLWKATTKIVCEKVRRDSGEVTSKKCISVKRFIRLYTDIMHQLAASSAASHSDDGDSESSQLCASMILDGLDAAPPQTSNISDECCICMERNCELILPCTHGYCEQCIRQWSETFRGRRVENRTSTCPLCRDPLEDASHHWVVPEKELASPEEMPSVVLGLVDQVAGGHTLPDSLSEEDSPLTTMCTSDGYLLVSHVETTPTA